jgi:hypothetical protein
MKPDKERQIIKRLVEQQLFLDKQRHELYKRTGTSLTSYSDPEYAVDFIDIACDILGFPVDTSVMQATGELPESIPSDKLYSRFFLPVNWDVEKEPIDEWLIERITQALYDQLHHDMLKFPHLFVDR